jgi:hypothetical protein
LEDTVTGTTQPQTITLSAGSTTPLTLGEDSGDSFIFAGTSPSNAPVLQFIGAGDNVVGALLVSAAATGSLSQDSQANVEVQGGVQVSGGSLGDFLQPGPTTLTLDGGSAINGGGSFVVTSAEEDVDLTGTITLGRTGSNTLDIGGVTSTDYTNLAGGTIIQDGANDLTEVGFSDGTDFQINAGVLKLSELGGPFLGTIGQISAAPGTAALGTSAEVDVYNLLNIVSASFDTTTDLLSFLNASGASVGQIQFAGDGSGLQLNTSTAGGIAHVAITDGVAPEQGNMPLVFHT